MAALLGGGLTSEAIGGALAGGVANSTNSKSSRQEDQLGLASAMPQMSLEQLMQMIQPRLAELERLKLDNGAGNPFVSFMMRGQQ